MGGKKYLEEQKGKPGVVTLPSGLMYKVLKEGTGEDHPTVDSPCECFYAGTTPSLTPKAEEVPDDTEKLNKEWNDFDSGYKRGSTTTFAPNQKIKGSKKPADKCDPETKKGCNDKQTKYLDKQGAATKEKRAAELKRLEGMTGGEMKDEAKNWLMSRIKLLKKLIKKDEL